VKPNGGSFVLYSFMNSSDKRKLKKSDMYFS
jgi:hypothetical protein